MWLQLQGLKFNWNISIDTVSNMLIVMTVMQKSRNRAEFFLKIY